MKKKETKILLLIAIFAVLLAGASMLYVKLSEKHMMNNLEAFPRLTLPSESEEVTQGQEEQPEQTDAPAEEGERLGGSSGNGYDFTVYDENGIPVKLSDYLGKPIVLNFWASWCGPCKSEMPAFEAKAKEYEGKVHFVMVNCTDGQRETVEKASAFISENGYTFPVFYDTDGEAGTLYEIASLPTTYFLDANGKLIARGVGGLNENSLQNGIDHILPSE